MIKIDIIAFIEWLKERWHSRLSIFFLSVVCILFLILFLSGVEFTKISSEKIGLILLIVIIVFFAWFFTTRVPKTENGKIGLIIAISTENKSQYNKLKSDFTETLHKFISQGNLKYQFHVIVYPEYYSRKLIDQLTAIEYLKKSEAHFMLFGRCRERNINNKQHFVLDLQGVVTHVPLPENTRKLFSAEFSELLPNRLTLALENDLFSFEFASDYISIVARYIVATASLLSADFEYSKTLFSSLRVELSKININIPAIVKIKQRIPQRLADTIVTIAHLKYIIFNNSKNISYLDEMGIALSELEKIPYDHYGGHLLRAAFIFLKYSDTKKALHEINRCKGNQDGAWMFSYSFLKAYDGDLKLAHNKYKNAFKSNYADSVPLECEEFIIDILEREPNKYQLYYCLGLINYFAKNDYPTAKKDFELFIKYCDPEKFTEQINYAREYISSIKM